jgi:hypothetical protein
VSIAGRIEVPSRARRTHAAASSIGSKSCRYLSTPRQLHAVLRPRAPMRAPFGRDRLLNPRNNYVLRSRRSSTRKFIVDCGHGAWGRRGRNHMRLAEASGLRASTQIDSKAGEESRQYKERNLRHAPPHSSAAFARCMINVRFRWLACALPRPQANCVVNLLHGALGRDCIGLPSIDRTTSRMTKRGACHRYGLCLRPG